jgi:hypothetical protein
MVHAALFLSLLLTQCVPPNPDCGDDHRTDREVCDGTDLDGRTCESLGFARGGPGLQR